MDEELIEDVLETEIYRKMKREKIPFVVVFYASWCSESRKLIGMISELARNYQGKTRFLKVKVEGEKRGEIASPGIYNFGKIKNYPTVALFQDGVMLGMFNFRKDQGFKLEDLDDIIQQTLFYFPR